MSLINSDIFKPLFLALLIAVAAGSSPDALARGKKQTGKKRAKPPVVKPETYAGRFQAEKFAVESPWPDPNELCLGLYVED